MGGLIFIHPTIPHTVTKKKLFATIRYDTHEKSKKLRKEKLEMESGVSIIAKAETV